MGEHTLLFLQLRKLSAIKSEEDLEHILSTLWRTRKTGLNTAEKTHFQSLLNLPSLGDVDPVLACLRSLIRKCAHENVSGADLSQLFPPDLPLDLHSILIVMFQKFQTQWKEEISRDQYLLPRTNFSNPVHASLGPGFTSFSSPEITASLWPRQDDHVAHFNHNNIGASTPIIAETDVSILAPMLLQQEASASNNLGTLPRLKSMTWTLENWNKTPTNRVIISLKLQDYTKSPLGEKDVKFQLTRDTLEAMLRSMSYINEQLSSSVASSLGALHKKQRQE